MGNRAGIILIQEDRLALIKRVKNGRTYYVLPGGQQEPGEAIEQTAVREALEELGVHVVVGELFVTVPFKGTQYYFFAHATGGMFGTGQGEEFTADDASGTYEAVWVALSKLAALDIIPREVVTALAHSNKL